MSLLVLIDEYRTRYPFQEIVPISALEGNNIDTLLKQIEDYLPEGPQFYPSDQVTDHPERFIISEPDSGKSAASDKGRDPSQHCGLDRVHSRTGKRFCVCERDHRRRARFAKRDRHRKKRQPA